MFKLTFPTSIIELFVLLSLSRAALGCSRSGSKDSTTERSIRKNTIFDPRITASSHIQSTEASLIQTSEYISTTVKLPETCTLQVDNVHELLNGEYMMMTQECNGMPVWAKSCNGAKSGEVTTNMCYIYQKVYGGNKAWSLSPNFCSDDWMTSCQMYSRDKKFNCRSHPKNTQGLMHFEQVGWPWEEKRWKDSYGWWNTAKIKKTISCENVTQFDAYSQIQMQKFCQKESMCHDGMFCGSFPQDEACRDCSFDECLQHAETNGSYAFSYTSTTKRLCRLCDEEDFDKKQYYRNWGLYIIRTPEPKTRIINDSTKATNQPDIVEIKNNTEEMRTTQENYSEKCQPKDSDNCLQTSPNWGSAYRCASSTEYCSSYGKDMRRCCPEACNTGRFTKEECISFSGSGTCLYPNDAQCPETSK